MPELKSESNKKNTDPGELAAAANTVREAEKATQIAVEDLAQADVALVASRLRWSLVESTEGGAEIDDAERLRRIRQGRVLKRKVAELEAESAHTVALAEIDAQQATGDEVAALALAAHLRLLMPIMARYDLWQGLQIPASRRWELLPLRGFGAHAVVNKFAEIAGRYLTATGRANIPVSRAMSEADFVQLAASAAQEPVDAPESTITTKDDPDPVAEMA